MIPFKKLLELIEYSTRKPGSFRIIILLLSQLVLFSCNSVLRYSEVNSEKIQFEEEFSDFNNCAVALEYFSDYTVIDSVELSASYYAHKFHKKKTASGEMFDMNGISAAHFNYPFGTILRLTNPSNQKQVIVRVNDRTYKKSKRKLDISLGAAKELDMIKQGVIMLKVEIVKWGEK